MISLRKLAQLAGVSHMTVHRALQGQGRISDATRARICALAEAYGYTPAPDADSTARVAVPTVACILPVSGFFSQLLIQFVQLAYTDGYELLHMEAPETEAPIAPLITRLIRARASAAFVFSPDYRPVSRTLINELRSHEVLPFVIGRPNPLLADTVKTDEPALVAQVVEYLLANGHMQIGYVGCSADERTGAFTAELRRRGLSLQHSTLPAALQHQLDLTRRLPAGALDSLLAHRPAPTAVFAMNDYFAAELLQQCYACGVQVPRDLSLIGCGNTETARFLSPRLTTVDQLVPSGIERLWHQFLRRKAHLSDEPQAPPVLLLHSSRIVACESCRRINA